MTEIPDSGWTFLDGEGTFELRNAQNCSYLYFPLVNEGGIFSSITPNLGGDIKADHNTFLTAPVSVEDLHALRATRNFWFHTDRFGAWSATGSSAAQIAQRGTPDEDELTLRGGLLWQQVERRSRKGLHAEITSFVPCGTDRVELMRVTLTNESGAALEVTPTAAVPIYGRSAENQRDHRHVTSLLHRTRCVEHGVLVTPTLSFDERGHQPNHMTYAVLGVEADGRALVGFFPVVEDFIGEGGTLDWPDAVTRNLPPQSAAGEAVDGYEAMGGLRFAPRVLQNGESWTAFVVLGLWEGGLDYTKLMGKYASPQGFDAALQATKDWWSGKVGGLRFRTGDTRFDGWARWVAAQPVLRRLFGNSFLPYHDYGRGGRGWRDLWQDILALLLMERGDVSELLYGNFAGVRIDGSNATIIGANPGEFKADRNNIPRVWMDHGAWPLLTTRLYLDQTGDLGFLLREQVYFKDHLIGRSTARDGQWSVDQGTLLRTASGEVYRGSVFEHLILQHLTPYYHTGEHGNILLEGADWNDGMDMARERGESVAFTALYAGNLRELAALARALAQNGTTTVELAEEMLTLLDLNGAPAGSTREKRERLERYFGSVAHTVSGRKVAVSAEALAADLEDKARRLGDHIREHEWVTPAEGPGWFNGYYDNDGQPVEGMVASGARMTLTGQVFALMCGIADEEQTRQVVAAAKRYLHEPAMGGYRLNTDFGEVRLNLGRCFGFAFGHKENGAMFSHMAVMYANALYRRGLVDEGWAALEEIYRQSQDFAKARMLPGIPEYFSARGRGMYPYLTGSASWYLLTLAQETFGLRGRLGSLAVAPRVPLALLDENGSAALETLFAGRPLRLVVHNPGRVAPAQAKVRAAKLNGVSAAVEGGLLISRARLEVQAENVLEVEVG